MTSSELPRIQRLTPERSRVLGEDPARKSLLDQILNAWSRREIDAAGQAQLAWLQVNPDDFGVLGAGESLAYAFEALCLKLLHAKGYSPLPPCGDPGEDSLMRRDGGPADQRIAVECVWTYRPAGINTVHALADSMRHLHATEGLLIAGTGVTDEARLTADRLGIQVIDAEELDRLLRTHTPNLLGDDVPPTSRQTPAERHARAATRMSASGQ